MNAYLTAMSNYATFRGRASRGEFWGYSLTLFLLLIIVFIIDEAIFGLTAEGTNPLAGLFVLAHLLPGLAVTIRRLHDIDKSGWWFLLSFTGIGAIVVLVMNVLAGTEGPNHFGPDPKAARGDARYAAAQPRRREPVEFGNQYPAYVENAVSEPQIGPSRRGGTADIIADLERLAQLKAAGAISEAEFDVMKAKALARVTD